MTKDTPLIWTITDGKIGDRVQCAGVAAGLGGSWVEKIAAPRAPFAWAAPWGPIDLRDGRNNPESAFSPPFPDIAIASGRRAVPYARFIKRASSGETFVVLLKDPRVRARFADLIWTPAHDQRRGENVFSTLASPHGLAPAIAAAKASPGPVIAALPKPMLGVVLGGPSGGARYDEQDADVLAAALNEAATDFASVAVSPSRRTPQAFAGRLRVQLSAPSVYVWDGEEPNPYTDILGGSASLVVAADSHNMMSEAVATEAGVSAWRPRGLAQKLDWFVSQLEERGRVRAFARSAAPFEAAPIDATPEIVAEIRRRLQQN